MQVSQVDLKALGIDPLRGRAKEGTGWPENNRDKEWDWKYYCLTCKLEVKRAYLCKAERKLNKTVYSPTNPNWILNRPASLTPRCPQCKELDKLITKQQRIDWFKANIAKIYEEEERLKTFQKKWKKFRKKHYNLLFNNKNYAINRDELKYKDQDMWQCHINLLQYIEDYGGMFMPRSESTKEDLKLVWELDHRWRTARKQNETANLMKNSAEHEINNNKYPRALQYFNKAIKARIDRTDLYLGRANLYFITGQYDKCITDCTIIIIMIDSVHTKLKQSGIYVQAYYNRAKAKKFQSKLVDAKKDLKAALLVDEDDMDCKKLLSEINTLLLLNKNEDKSDDIKQADNDDGDDDDTLNKIGDISLDEDELLFEGCLDFLKTAEDKTSEAEYKLFTSLFKLIKKSDVYYNKFINDRNGIDLCLNYMRSKFKSSNSKITLKDLGKPGLDELMKITNDIIIDNKDKNDNIDLISFKKLISNNILYIFTLYVYMHSILQYECLKFASFMMNIIEIKKCVQNNYVKPLMERYKKLSRKIKVIQTPILDNFILKCMTALFDDDGGDNKINIKIAGMYNNNEILYEWMVKYIKYCNNLKHSDKNYNVSFDNLSMILHAVSNTINYIDDASFYMLYNQTKQKQFGFLVAYLNKLKQIDINKIDEIEEKEKEEIQRYQLQITAITSCLEVFNALSNKEQGRKFMLMEKFNDGHKNYINILILIQNKEKYKNKLKINDKLAIYIDNYFRKLIQQKQDNDEQKEIDDKEAEERRKKEEIEEKERKEKEEKERKEKEEKQRLEKLKKEKEQKKEEEKEKKREAADGDLDALSDSFDEEEYLKNIELEEEMRKKKEKTKQEKKKKKDKKKKKKKKKDDDYSPKVFVSQKPPAKFNGDTLNNVFGDKLSAKEIETILSISSADK